MCLTQGLQPQDGGHREPAQPPCFPAAGPPQKQMWMLTCPRPGASLPPKIKICWLPRGLLGPARPLLTRAMNRQPVMLPGAVSCPLPSRACWVTDAFLAHLGRPRGCWRLAVLARAHAASASLSKARVGSCPHCPLPRPQPRAGPASGALGSSSGKWVSRDVFHQHKLHPGGLLRDVTRHRENALPLTLHQPPVVRNVRSQRRGEGPRELASSCHPSPAGCGAEGLRRKALMAGLHTAVLSRARPPRLSPILWQWVRNCALSPRGSPLVALS